jgi:hypothetical protein
MRNYLGLHFGGSICCCEVTYRPTAILSLQIYQTSIPMGYGDQQEVNGRTTTTVSGQDSLLSAHSSTSSSVLKVLHSLSSHIHQSPTMNGLELAVMIPQCSSCSGMASKTIARTPSSRVRVTRDLAIPRGRIPVVVTDMTIGNARQTSSFFVTGFL